MNRRRFYLARLRNASFSELVYRASQMFLVWRLKNFVKKYSKPFSVPFSEPTEIKEIELPIFSGEITYSEVAAISEEGISHFNENKSKLDEYKKYRNLFFADIKQTDGSPDIRSVWESARLQHITKLLIYAVQNQLSSDSIKFKQFAKSYILKWIRENPFLFGPHYLSAMECGLRIPVFFYGLKIIKDFTTEEYQRILEAIYLHAWWISKRLSLYSSLGNHTIAECLGLIFAGAIFRKEKQGQEWLESAVSLLKQELKHQILEDGGPAEQSLHYHRFVLDLYWLAVDFLERNHLIDGTGIKNRLISGEKFLGAFTDTFGRLPSIGDSDDSYAVAPGIFPERPNLESVKEGHVIFAQAGYTVIRFDQDSIFTFDHGPLGMAPLYNHGHGDALSVTLALHGQSVLIDPGTYRYHGVPEHRRYFKGTRAHNTVTVDGMDQAVQVTGFIWSRPFQVEKVKCTHNKEGLLLSAVHNGYARFKKPVWHKRSVLFFDHSHFLIKDSFAGEGFHVFEMHFHLQPDVVVGKADDWWYINNGTMNVFIKLLGKDEFSFVRGQENPLLGWYSPAYGVLRECGALHCLKEGEPEAVIFITVICTKSTLEPSKLAELAESLE
jgi:hypothetical protein